jgi:hypothetical protein
MATRAKEKARIDSMTGASQFSGDVVFLPLLHNTCGGEGWGEEAPFSMGGSWGRGLLSVPLSMNLEAKAPSPQPSPAEREREQGRQRGGNAAKFMGSMREFLFRRNLSPLGRARGRRPRISK